MAKMTFTSGEGGRALPHLDDPYVHNLACATHQPEQAWAQTSGIDGREDGILIYLRCACCYQEWPCATRQELTRTAEAKRAARPAPRS